VSLKPFQEAWSQHATRKRLLQYPDASFAVNHWRESPEPLHQEQENLIEAEEEFIVSMADRYATTASRVP